MTIHHKIGLRYPGVAGVVLALLVALSGCHKEVGESGPTGESDGGARHVRIAASIDSYSLPGSRPSTRAAGTWEEVPGSGIWNPEAELGLDYERAVYFAVLYIYPDGAKQPSTAWIYYTNAFAAGFKSLKEDKSSPLSEIKDDLEELSQNNSQVRHFASTESSALTMDLELEPGKYKFVLVANSIPALTSAIESTTNPADPHDLKSKETAFTSLDLMPNTVTKLPRRFMPMVGSQDFTITSSTAVPQVISSPTIDLERTFARLDVCLTTADKDLTAYHEKDGNVPTDFRFLEYSLKGMGGYEQPLFPLEGETTEIKEKSTAKVAAPTTSEEVDPKITVESKEGSILLSNITKSFDEKGANTFNTPTKLSTSWAEPIQVSKLWKSPIFRTTTDETEPAGKYYTTYTKDRESASADEKHPAIHIYIPSLYQERSKDYEVSFTLKFGRATDASQTKEYTISLTNQRDATDLYAIRRNTWYRYELKFYGEKMRVLGPLTITPQDWSLEEQDFSYDDEYIVLTQDTVTLSANEGAKGKFMILSDQLGSDPKSLTYTFNGKSTPPDWLEMEGKLPTSLNKGESTEIAFHTLSENEDDNDMPRVCELVITPKDYKRPLRVVIRQLPIQYIQARPYVAFVGDEDSGPLSTEIAVETHNYDWEAEVVDTYCTAASKGNWLKVKKLDDRTLEIKVDPVEARMNILRIGMIKIYDGTNHPAYIRVEQGGYKAIELENGQVWLDRNMGALSYAHYEQWKGGAVITGFDRVRVNGAFYQTGRVPDGYQYNGMDLLAGNIHNELTDAEKIDILASRQPRRLGDASGTGSSSIVSPEEQLPAADPQYHKFIAGTQDDWFSQSFRDPKWFTYNRGEKNHGLDPCPEGYRIPFQNEFKTMIKGEQITREGGRAGGSKFYENAMGYFYKTKKADHSLYIPLGGWRDIDGSLQDWWKVNDVTPKAKYAFYYRDPKAPLQAGYYLLGYDNSMKFFAAPEAKTAEGLLVRCIKITDK